MLDAYLALTGDPDAAASAARDLARRAGLDDPRLEAALALFEERNGFIAARGLPLERFVFTGSFARNLDYYTGFIFEVGQDGEKPVVGGGRYDGLLQHLGSRDALPAVGCSFWLERLGGER